MYRDCFLMLGMSLFSRKSRAMATLPGIVNAAYFQERRNNSPYNALAIIFTVG